MNEEAGKLLLEQYDDYSSRARMMTDIHAKPSRSSRAEVAGNSSANGDTSDCLDATGKKRPIDRSSATAFVGVEKKKKDKKRALKRL